MKTGPLFTSALLVLLAAACGTDSELEEYKALCRQEVCSEYKQMYRPGGEGAFIHPYLTPGSKSYSNVLWDWDSYFTDVALRQILALDSSEEDRQEALQYEKGCVLNFLDYTDPDGYMPIGIDRRTDPRQVRPAEAFKVNMHKPVIAQHAAFICSRPGCDAEWIRPYYPRLQAFIEAYFAHHRHAGTGLLYWQDDMAIGVDTDPSTFFRPAGSSASIFLNCLMYRELLAMKELSLLCGYEDRALYYDSLADELKEAVRRYCWDEKDGMYYSVDIALLPAEPRDVMFFGHPFQLHKGAPRDYPCLIQRLGVWSGFMTLWAGIATEEQAERMVKENLLDSDTFWSEYGVRTLSKMEAMYSMRASGNPSNWNGPIWGISNYLVFRGLVRYGFTSEARSLAHNTITLYGKDLKQNGSLHEYYNPETGEGIINPGFQNWNYLVLNMIAWLEGAQAIEEF